MCGKDLEVKNLGLQKGAKVGSTNDCGDFMLKFIDHVIQRKSIANVIQRNMDAHRKGIEQNCWSFVRPIDDGRGSYYLQLVN